MMLQARNSLTGHLRYGQSLSDLAKVISFAMKQSLEFFARESKIQKAWRQFLGSLRKPHGAVFSGGRPWVSQAKVSVVSQLVVVTLVSPLPGENETSKKGIMYISSSLNDGFFISQPVQKCHKLNF